MNGSRTSSRWSAAKARTAARPLASWHTAGITGAEVGIAGGTAVIGQKVLEAIFGDQAVRELARKARERLVEKVTQAYAAEHNRYAEAVAKLSVRDEQAARLAKAAAMIEAAR